MHIIHTFSFQGNPHNQNVAFDNKVIDCVNFILRNKQYKACKFADILELQSTIYQCVKSMCEENRAAKDMSKVGITPNIQYP